MNRFMQSLILLALVLPTSMIAQTFKFAHISDTHIGSSATAAEDLERTVRDINAQTDIAFVIHSGDVTEFGSDLELREAKNILNQLNKPLYIVPGNHDTKWSESGCNSFKAIFGAERFVFDYAGYRFIGCSSGPNMRMAPGLVPREDLVWMDSIIMATPANQPIIFVNHYPLDAGLANWYQVLDILKKRNTQVALCGHGHRNKHIDAAGIPNVMGRSNLRAKDPVGGYNLVSVQFDTLYYAERRPLKAQAPEGIQVIEAEGETLPVWNKVFLYKHRYENFDRPQPDFSINEKFPQVKTVWKFQDKSDIGTGIVANADLAVYGNSAGQVRAVDVKTGKLLWQFATRGKVFSTPALATDRVVIASTDSSAYCLNLKTGKALWKVKTGKSIVASPLIEGGVVYLGASDGKFRALNLADGKVLWTFNGVMGFVESTPCVDAERVYFGDWGTYFYALDKKTGKFLWRWSNGQTSRLYSPAACLPVLADGKVFIAAPDRHFTALDAATGKDLWRSNYAKGRESIGISGDKQELYCKTMQDSLVVFDLKGEKLWSLNLKFGYEIGPSPTVEKGGIIYIATDKGVIYTVDRQKKQVLWAHKLSNALVNNVFPLGNGEVLTTTMDGWVARLKE